MRLPRYCLWMIALFLVGPLGLAQENLKSMPTGSGLPISVRVGMYVAKVVEINDNSGNFTAQINLRLRWKDMRLAFDRARNSNMDRIQYFHEEAAAKLATIWTPSVKIINMKDQPQKESFGVYVYFDGMVEVIRVVTAVFETSFDITKFPFDRQQLAIEVSPESEDNNAVILEYTQDDLTYSGVSQNCEVANWQCGLIDLRTTSITTWNGAVHSKVTGCLNVTRVPYNYIPTIFLPIFAILLIPILAIGLNSFEDKAFKVEPFDLVNMVISGLFAVIALNFTINSGYQALVSGDNTVNRLFALSYVLLFISLMVNIILFKSKLVFNFLGAYVVEQIFIFLCWSFPVLSVVSFVMILWSAMV